jgi:hypothetical protein
MALGGAGLSRMAGTILVPVMFVGVAFLIATGVASAIGSSPASR